MTANAQERQNGFKHSLTNLVRQFMSKAWAELTGEEFIQNPITLRKNINGGR